MFNCIVLQLFAWKNIIMSAMILCVILLFMQIVVDATRLVFQIQITVLHFDFSFSVNDSRGEILNSEFVFILQMMVQFMHLPENLALVYGISKFCYYVRIHGNEWQNLAETPSKLIEHLISIKCSKNGALCVIIISFVIVTQIPLAFAPPILYYIWRKNIIISYNNSQSLATDSAIVLFFPHFSNLVDRIAMIAVTLIVRAMWDKTHESKLDLPAKYEEYKKICRCVASIQGIFQEWFVLKWITYYFSIAGNIILSIRGVFKPSFQLSFQEHTFLYSTTHLIYDLVAFTTIFICGRLMNKYHREYYKKLEKVHRNDILTLYQKEESQNDRLSTKKVIEIMEISTLIPEEAEYKFRPSLCGLSFELNSAGYLITFALAVIGIVNSILNTSGKA